MEIKKYYGDERDAGYELAIDLLTHGVSKKEIIDMLGISKELLYNWRRTAGVVFLENYEKYDTEKELNSKLEELKKYSGFYKRVGQIDQKEEKKTKAKELFEKGYSIHKVSKMVNISKCTAEKWSQEFGCPYFERQKDISNKVWAVAWCKEWDDFMKRLKRPLRIARVDK